MVSGIKLDAAVTLQNLVAQASLHVSRRFYACSIWNTAVGNTIYKQDVSRRFYASSIWNTCVTWQVIDYTLPGGWHDNVETCRSVKISEIIVRLLVIVQNKKKIY